MSNDDNDSQQPSPALSRLARVLEQRLYSSAKNCAEYCDTTTLESRLRTVLQQRRIQRLRSHTQPQRQLFLKQRLGLDKFHQLDQLVTQIQQEKNELVGQSCPNCQFRGPKLNTAFEAKLPIPVQLLFFDTPLVDVFRKYSISRLTAQQDFRRLEQQAQQHLSEFQTWKMQNDVCEIQKWIYYRSIAIL